MSVSANNRVRRKSTGVRKDRAEPSSAVHTWQRQYFSRLRSGDDVKTDNGFYQQLRQQPHHEKGRIYTCCVCSALDITKLHDYLKADFFAASTWKFDLIGDTLRLYKMSAILQYRERSSSKGLLKEKENASSSSLLPLTRLSEEGEFIGAELNADLDSASSISDAQEIFIFDSGASVFWGFAKGEESGMLRIITDFAISGTLDKNALEDSEDDMNFIVANSLLSSSKSQKSRVSIANNSVYLSDRTNAKQRLAVSYAIAQSSILKVMETRIENRMDEYEFIPTQLAKGMKQ